MSKDSFQYGEPSRFVDPCLFWYKFRHNHSLQDKVPSNEVDHNHQLAVPWSLAWSLVALLSLVSLLVDLLLFVLSVLDFVSLVLSLLPAKEIIIGLLFQSADGGGSSYLCCCVVGVNTPSTITSANIGHSIGIWIPDWPLECWWTRTIKNSTITLKISLIENRASRDSTYRGNGLPNIAII